MYIDINSNTRITTNRYAWVVEELLPDVETEELVWTETKNYTSLESLMKNFVELLVRQNVKGSKGLVKEIGKINDAFVKALSKQKSLIVKLGDINGVTRKL
tara:strand:+ start:1082 stop:1384 length:303 start_codon:yes stop_codon:yes gene_type:complete